MDPGVSVTPIRGPLLVGSKSGQDYRQPAPQTGHSQQRGHEVQQIAVRPTPPNDRGDISENMATGLQFSGGAGCPEEPPSLTVYF